MLSDRFVGGRSVGTMENKELVKPHKGTVKTIEGKNGDVIDCVNIYQQPAFNHPLLKNHTIQMESGSIPNVRNEELHNVELFQDWHENGECPTRTIPIRRLRADEHYAPHGTTPSVAAETDNSNGYEFAGGIIRDGHFYGAHASLNVWSPALNDGFLSASQVWLISGSSPEQNRIEVGWQVASPSKEPKLYISWTRDAYKSTGCSDLNCPGFVQTSNKIALGSIIKPSSSYNGKQFEIGITIYKSYGDWYLKVKNEVLGYWPMSLFTHLSHSAETVFYGGMIFNAKLNNHHTSTHMGSGHFPSEGHGKASYVRSIQYMDGHGKFKDANGKLEIDVTNPSCYDVNVVNNNNIVYGSHLYFGGPGYSEKCP
ncbi:protein neprosin-like [Corylus avellana]|uniref:protein neprosin-like n=1 Tax=Corylus avellana TaxID=13451 RepID=UPI001E210C64|nr:protein neprosin-like [Corylus avellana]